MSSTKGKARARQLARAKHERQLARRAKSARRRRQWKAMAGIVAILLAGVGVAWFFGAFSGSDSSDDKPASEESSAPEEDAGDESSPPEEDDEPSQDDKDE